MTVTALALGISCTSPAVTASLASAAPTPTTIARDPHIQVATWTDGPWPFTEADGRLGCTTQDKRQVQTFTANGVVYALNMSAEGTGRFPSVDPIWSQDPNAPDSKMNIAEVLDYAKSLCVG